MIGLVTVVLLVTAGIFALDLSLGRSSAAGFGYALAVAATWSIRARWPAVTVAAVGTLFALLAHFLTPADDRPWAALANRGLGITAIWVVAMLIVQHQHAQARHAAVVRELDHRLKNTLSAVLSIADQTVAGSSSLGEFTPAFAGRLRAMAIAHELLSRTEWRGVDLRELLERVLEPYERGSPDRFELVGAAITLSPNAAPSLSMVVQELATNAARYGALSDFDGRVRIAWSRELGEDGARLHLTWSETGGPPVAAERSAGFGTDLVERLIAYQTQGEASLDFDETGVRCTVDLPEAAFS
jgi:two-component sensor histidine kinase